MIDFLLLGTGAMTPLPNRWLSSLLVRCQGQLVLFDCGEGTQIPWRAFGWGFRNLSAICFSHWHADHIAGLPGLLHSIANSGRTEPIAICGPVETRRVVDGLRSIAPHLPFDVQVHELAAGDRAALPAGMTASVIAGQHRVPSLIYRVDLPRAPRFDREAAERLGIPVTLWKTLRDGQSALVDGRTVSPENVLGGSRPGLSFGYMTDTRPVPDAGAFLYGVDLLVSEGTYGDSAKLPKAIANMHMTYAEVATIAREAGAKRLWLTHFSPAMDDPELWAGNAEAIFPATTIGHSGLTLSLAFPDDQPET
jgi:ribonuclease Z